MEEDGLTDHCLFLALFIVLSSPHLPQIRWERSSPATEDDEGECVGAPLSSLLEFQSFRRSERRLNSLDSARCRHELTGVRL